MMTLVNYDWWALALAAVAGLACGFLNTVASSGSAVSLPILMFIGLDPLTANATNRIPVLLGAFMATISFHRKGAIQWPLALKISVPVTLGSLLGALDALSEMRVRMFGSACAAELMFAMSTFHGLRTQPNGFA